MSLFSSSGAGPTSVPGWFAALTVTALTAAACSTPPSGTLTPSAAAVSAESKPGQSSIPANMTFRDAAGDAITSDGGGAYPSYNGTVGCELLGGSLTCILSGSGRSLNYNLNAIISGSGPTGALNDQSNFTVNNVGSLAVGSTTTAQALFHTAIGQFNFNPAGDATTSAVFVTRVSTNTWTVDTSAGDVANLVHTAPDPHNPHKTISVVWGYYHLPFSFTAVTQ